MKIGIAETLGYSVLGIAIVFLMLIILMGIELLKSSIEKILY